MKVKGNLKTESTKTIDNISGMLKAASGVVSAANAGSDYQAPIGYTPEDQGNKSTNLNSDKASDTKYPSCKAVDTFVYNQQVNAYPPGTASGGDFSFAAANVFEQTITDNTAFTISNYINGKTAIIIIHSTGANTLTFSCSGKTIKWPGGVQPEQTADGTDVYTFVCCTDIIYISVVQDMQA